MAAAVIPILEEGAVLAAEGAEWLLAEAPAIGSTILSGIKEAGGTIINAFTHPTVQTIIGQPVVQQVGLDIYNEGKQAVYNLFHPETQIEEPQGIESATPNPLDENNYFPRLRERKKKRERKKRRITKEEDEKPVEQLVNKATSIGNGLRFYQ